MRKLIALVVLAALLSVVIPVSAAARTFLFPAWNPKNPSQLTYVSNGQVLLLRELSKKIPFSLLDVGDSCRITGNTWHPDGRITYSRQCAANSAIYLLTQKEGKVLTNSVFIQSQPGTKLYAGAWSPSGKLFAYTACASNGMCGYQIYDVEEKSLTEVGEKLSAPYIPAWMENEHELMMIIERGQTTQIGIWRGGKQASVLTNYTTQVNVNGLTYMENSKFLFTTGKLASIWSVSYTGNTSSVRNFAGKQPAYNVLTGTLAFIGVQDELEGQIIIAPLSNSKAIPTCLTCTMP